jgi:hypothetical protein
MTERALGFQFAAERRRRRARRAVRGKVMIGGPSQNAEELPGPILGLTTTKGWYAQRVNGGSGDNGAQQYIGGNGQRNGRGNGNGGNGNGSL